MPKCSYPGDFCTSATIWENANDINPLLRIGCWTIEVAASSEIFSYIRTTPAVITTKEVGSPTGTESQALLSCEYQKIPNPFMEIFSFSSFDIFTDSVSICSRITCQGEQRMDRWCCGRCGSCDSCSWARHLDIQALYGQGSGGGIPITTILSDTTASPIPTIFSPGAAAPMLCTAAKIPIPTVLSTAGATLTAGARNISEPKGRNATNHGVSRQNIASSILDFNSDRFSFYSMGPAAIITLPSGALSGLARDPHEQT